MKKLNSQGFMLAETLIVTAFVAGVLLFLFIQFSNLNEKYSESYKYNTVEDLYALRNVRDFVKKNVWVSSQIQSISNTDFFNLFESSNCEAECKSLLNLEQIDTIYVTKNYFEIDNNSMISVDEDIKQFAKLIKPKGNEGYRIIARFKNSTYATIRFDLGA